MVIAQYILLSQMVMESFPFRILQAYVYKRQDFNSKKLRGNTIKSNIDELIVVNYVGLLNNPTPW